MFAQTIVEFADYLNEAEYSVTPDKVTQFLSSFSDEDIDCTDINDLVSSMRFYFCKTRWQRQDISMHFQRFLKLKESYTEVEEKEKKIDQTKEEKDQRLSMHNKKQMELSKEISELEEKVVRIEEETKRNWEPDKTKFSKTDLAFLTKKKKWISNLNMPDVENILSGKGIDEKDLKNAQKTVMKMTETFMKKGNLDKMDDLNKLFKILQKVKIAKKKEQPRREAAIRQATKETREKLESLKEKKRREKLEHDRLQNELTEKIERLRKESVIYKPEAIKHRQEFIDGNHSVQIYKNISCPPEAEKEFKKLTLNDKQLIYKYIHDNILKFKTRMTRNILEMYSGRIDMCETIRNACRTGGLPMDIIKEIRKPGKANLILILDVSGSCKEASEMMITFIYLLQEVFPRGCQAYAFVNSLFDITDIMKARNAEEAISTTLDTIPRRGQYSNYEKPIRDMWENKKSKITKDSIVIMIGDARNNKNGPAENEFKNIVRRAKKTYWLNTDQQRKWGQGDSIAPLYARYCKMFEARTPKSIVQFLDQGMR